MHIIISLFVFNGFKHSEFVSFYAKFVNSSILRYVIINFDIPCPVMISVFFYLSLVVLHGKISTNT